MKMKQFNTITYVLDNGLVITTIVTGGISISSWIALAMQYHRPCKMKILQHKSFTRSSRKLKNIDNLRLKYALLQREKYRIYCVSLIVCLISSTFIQFLLAIFKFFLLAAASTLSYSLLYFMVFPCQPMEFSRTPWNYIELLRTSHDVIDHVITCVSAWEQKAMML